MSAEKQAFNNLESFNAYFYTLVSQDTEEMKFADQRQQYLVDQGFYFEVIEELPFMKQKNREDDKDPLIMSKKKEQRDLMDSILKNKETEDMGIEDFSKLEKDDDKKMLDEDILREKKESANIRGLTEDTYMD
jgi:hypothetical protein